MGQAYPAKTRRTQARRPPGEPTPPAALQTHPQTSCRLRATRRGACPIFAGPGGADRHSQCEGPRRARAIRRGSPRLEVRNRRAFRPRQNQGAGAASYFAPGLGRASRVSRSAGPSVSLGYLGLLLLSYTRVAAATHCLPWPPGLTLAPPSPPTASILLSPLILTRNWHLSLVNLAHTRRSHYAGQKSLQIHDELNTTLLYHWYCCWLGMLPLGMLPKYW